MLFGCLDLDFSDLYIELMFMMIDIFVFMWIRNLFMDVIVVLIGLVVMGVSWVSYLSNIIFLWYFVLILMG